MATSQFQQEQKEPESKIEKHKSLYYETRESYTTLISRRKSSSYKHGVCKLDVKITSRKDFLRREACNQNASEIKSTMLQQEGRKGKEKREAVTKLPNSKKKKLSHSYWQGPIYVKHAGWRVLDHPLSPMRTIYNFIETYL